MPKVHAGSAQRRRADPLSLPRLCWDLVDPCWPHAGILCALIDPMPQAETVWARIDRVPGPCRPFRTSCLHRARHAPWTRSSAVNENMVLRQDLSTTALLQCVRGTNSLVCQGECSDDRWDGAVVLGARPLYTITSGPFRRLGAQKRHTSLWPRT